MFDKLILVISLIYLVRADVSCEFKFTTQYECKVFITNPYALDNFAYVSGVHVGGKTANDVVFLYPGGASPSANFPRIICDTFTHLKTIDYQGRGLIKLTGASFEKCTELENLNLASNSITEITDTTFLTTIALKDLNLRGNHLTSLPQNVFWHLKSLDTLNLGNNAVNLPALVFHNLTALHTISLGNCDIVDWQTWWFSSIKSLKSIDMSMNNITRIPQFAFHEDVQINSLNINFNQVTRLDRNSFGNLASFQNIHAEFNEIKEIERTIFTDAALITANFNENVCIKENFNPFSKASHLSRFENCFQLYDSRTVCEY